MPADREAAAKADIVSIEGVRGEEDASCEVNTNPTMSCFVSTAD